MDAASNDKHQFGFMQLQHKHSFNSTKPDFVFNHHDKSLFINMSEVKLLFRIQRQSERHLL